MLNINPESSKAYYRSAVALLCLDRSEEALDCCDRCLSFDTHNQGVKSVRDRAAKAKAETDRKQREKEDRLRKERDEERALQAALEARNPLLTENHVLTDQNVGETLVSDDESARDVSEPLLATF